MSFTLIWFTIRATKSFVPFILSHEDDHHVKISKDLLILRFNLGIGSMYVEQKMHSPNSDILEILGFRKTCLKMVSQGFGP